jgi:Uma2 family endonuclease
MTVIAAGKKQITADELLAMGDIGRCELIDGEIIHMAPAGAQHGGIAGQVYGYVWTFVMAHKLGRVFTAETGFVIGRNPDTVRAPDVAFVQSNRISGAVTAGFFDGPPDLAVEVCSPNDRWSEVLAKIDQWLAAGCTSVWVVDPPSKSIEVYRRGSQSIRYHAGQQLVDEPTLPGFTLDVGEVFK